MLKLSSNLRKNVVQIKRGFALAGRKPVDGKGEEWRIFPFEREGMEMNLNWALNRVKVIPRGDAFHNPRPDLVASKLQLDPKSRVISLKDFKLKYSAKILEAGTPKLSFEDYDTAEQLIQSHFSQSGIELFVTTGAVGSFRDGSLAVRVITDHPGVSVLAKNLLIDTPYIKYEDHTSQLPPITIYCTGQLNDFAGIEYMEGENGSLEGARVVLAGAHGKNLQSLENAIKEAASALLLENENLVTLPASVLRNGAKTALLFNAKESDLTEGLNAGSIYCSKGSVIYGSDGFKTLKGIGSMFGGVIVPNTNPKNNENWSVNIENCEVLKHAPDNLVFSPKIALFMGESSGKLSEEKVRKNLEGEGMEEDAIGRFFAAGKSGNILFEEISSVKAALGKVA